MGGIKVRVTIQRVRTWCGAFLPDAIGMRALELAEKAEGHSREVRVREREGSLSPRCQRWGLKWDVSWECRARGTQTSESLSGKHWNDGEGLGCKVRKVTEL